jgi:hypothetical protein
MNRVALCVVVCSVICAWPAAVPAETLTRVVDFDHGIDGSAIPSGRDVTAAYAWWHVTFGLVSGGQCWACCTVANGNCVYRSTISPPNWASLRGSASCPDISESRDGLISATLDVPCSFVSIVIDPTGEASQGVLRAYDVDGMLIDETVSQPGILQTISLTAAGIRRADFSGLGSSLVRCDDFTFAYDTTSAENATWGAIKALYR